jgi:hypothetical protein
VGVSADIDLSTQDNFTMWTGNTVKKAFGVGNVGELGCFSCVIGSNTIGGQTGTVSYFNGTITVTNATAKVLDLAYHDVIPTNMIFNSSNINKFKNTSYDGSCDVVNRDEGIEMSFKDTASLESIDIEWKLSRTDDELTLPNSNQWYKLTNQYLQDLGPGDPVYVAATTPAGGSYFDITKRDPSNPGGLVNRVIMYGSEEERSQYKVYCSKYLPSGWTPKKLIKNEVTIANLYPFKKESEFQAYPPNKDIAYLERLYSYLETSDALKIGLIPIFYKDGSEPDPNLKNVAFIGSIYTGQNVENIPFPIQGETFCVGSPSILDNYLAKMVTTQKTDTTEYPQWDAGDQYANIQPYDYVPYVYAGAANSQITFDDTTTRFGIQSFHIPRKQGNGVFQDTTDPQTSSPGEDVLTSEYSRYALSVQISSTLNIGYNEIVDYITDQADELKTRFADSQSGIGILKYLAKTTSGDEFNVLNYNTKVFDKTLFAKLGFQLEQLLPFFGSSDSLFNRGNYNKFLGSTSNPYSKYQNMVRPLTTNAYVSGAEQLALVVGWGEDDNSDVISIPMYNLGGSIPIQSQTNATSDTCYASELPSKLDYSYLVLRSDIFRGSQGWYGSENGRQKLPALAYVTRNYSSGNYFYAFATQWEYIVDNSYLLSDITTDITLPDGRIASLGKDSSVIYKIVKPKVLPPSAPPIEESKRESSSDRAKKQNN